ncbi:unnamed protein product [Victoria cruziana]
MAENQVERRNSGTQLLQEIEALSHTLYQSHTARRTASLSLPSSAEALSGAGFRGQADDAVRRKRSSTSTITGKPAPEVVEVRGRSRRMSLSPWRSRPKAEDVEDRHPPESGNELPTAATAAAADRKKGIWNWKPIRALSHIGMQKLSVLFSVEVVAVQGVPASMNGLRLAVCVRKQETKDGALQTMPSRVMQGAADFEETLFLRCHVYFSSSKHSPGVFRFEPRPFHISVVAVDAEELDFGRNLVDLSNLVQESMERNADGARVRQWDAAFKLSGKAKGAELVLKLGFQIMEKDGGIFKMEKTGDPFVRKQSKSSFSVPSSNVGSPRITAIVESPKSTRSAALQADLHKIEHLNLDDDDDDQPAPPPAKSHEPEDDAGDDLPEFEVVDKGIEIQKPEKPEPEPEVAESEENEEGLASSEVVKEVVDDKFHKRRLTELDAIAEQIRALESLIRDDKRAAKEYEFELQNLDAEEETVTREFLQMLEEEGEADAKSSGFQFLNDRSLKMEREADDGDKVGLVFLPDLGKGLGSVVQTRDGGFLAAANPLNVAISRKDHPELAVQVTKQVVFPVNINVASGFDIVQKLAALGAEELSTRPFSLMPIDDLSRKAPEQIAFEGIASAVISGRKKEVASSSAARSVAAIRKITAAMNSGRKERIETGIWNAEEDPVTVHDLMATALQKIEAVAVEALKIQADMADDEPPFEISAIVGKPDPAGSLFTNAVQVDRWEHNSSTNSVSLAALLQLRDPSRQLEAVGAPMLVIVQAMRFRGPKKEDDEDDELKFKATSIHVTGLKVRPGGKRNLWDGDRQRLTAAQWLVAHGLGKSGKKEKQPGRVAKGPTDLIWSLSARVVAGLWLKQTRNPDIKFPRQTAAVS